MYFYVFSVVTTFVALVFFVWIIKVIYLAFIKKKDIQEKILITKSMAQSFIVVLILSVINFFSLSFNNIALILSNLGNRIDIHPVALNLIVLGITISINKKRLKLSMKGG